VVSVLRTAFEDRFGRAPRFAAAAPGRVNLIGDHTDYNDGFVLPIAIDRNVVVVADYARGDRSTLCAIDLDESVTVDLAGPISPVPKSFANYLLGVAAGFATHGTLPNLDVAISGTVPIGAGLGSSAALEVAFATLLRQVTGSDIGPLGLAELCRRAEHEFAGTPCGIMDMLTATLARPGYAMLIDCRDPHARPIPMPPADDVTVLVADTTVRHDLADGAYAERRRRCFDAATGLGVSSLREADIGLLATAPLDDRSRRAAQHVCRENQRVLLVAAALFTGDLDVLGELMFDSHASLRDLLDVSCEQLDSLVEIASGLRGREGGVIGARMTGGGFGGCVVILCRTDALARVTAELQCRYAERFGAPPACFTVTAAGPARPCEP